MVHKRVEENSVNVGEGRLTQVMGIAGRKGGVQGSGGQFGTTELERVKHHSKKIEPGQRVLGNDTVQQNEITGART